MIKASVRKNEFALSRRSFLIGSAGTALVMGFGGLLPIASARAAVEKRQFSPTVWFEMNENGQTRINIAKAEMGQHVGTALARVIADELCLDWNDVEIVHVDTEPKWGHMLTGGSWSVFTTFKQLSQAGAAGRTVLVEEGAKILGTSPSACMAEAGFISDGEKKVSYGEIVRTGNIDRQFTAEELEAMPVKPASQRTLIGKNTKAIDVPAKSTGSAMYGIDVDRDGMVYARPLIPPTRYGSIVRGVNDRAAKKIKGFIGYEVLEDPSNTLQGWVVALADNYWSAVKAADAIEVDWEAGPTAGVSEEEIHGVGLKQTSDMSMGSLFVDEGDVTAAVNNADHVQKSVYRTSTVLHFTLEPANAVAEKIGDTWHIYSGNQWQSLILPMLAQALGVAEDKIVIHQYYLGGGFGRRLFGDYILPAALASKKIGKPVKLVFTRDDDSRFDCVRSASVQQFTASYDKDNNLTGIDHGAAAGWPTKSMAPDFLGDGLRESGKFDGFSINGADHWYTLPNHRVRAINNELAQQTFLPGWLRAVGPGWIGWGVESFMDEVAHRLGEDPVKFRLSMLDGKGKNAGKAPESVNGAMRLANVLQRCAKKSDWGKSLPTNEGMGIATCFGQERTMPTWIAVAAHVAIDRETGDVDLKKLWLSIDCGTPVHPDGAMAQAQGAALWGVSLALHEGTRFENGQVADTNLDRYTPLRMKDVPELDIDFVNSTEFPTGMGEPPLIAVAPAIGNAIYDAVGVRVRDLPIRSEVIRAAL